MHYCQPGNCTSFLQQLECPIHQLPLASETNVSQVLQLSYYIEPTLTITNFKSDLCDLDSASKLWSRPAPQQLTSSHCLLLESTSETGRCVGSQQ